MTDFLLQVLRTFKKEVVILCAISAVLNLLMLLPTIYMLQIFDRVMISRNELTLLIVSLITLGLYGVQAFSEWVRGRMVGAVSVSLDQKLSIPVFRAIFQDRLKGRDTNAIQTLGDLTSIRQFLTGSGLTALLDGPWTPIYLIIMFVLHPALGLLTLAVMALMAGFALYASSKTSRLSEASQEEERDLNDFIFHKLRNAEVIEAHGMAQNFRNRWWQRQSEFLKTQAFTEDMEERFTASTKQLRFLTNSLAIAVGALLVIEGQLTLGAMIAAGLLMGRATAPVDVLVGGWRGFVQAKLAVGRIQSLLEENAETQSRLARHELKGHIQVRNLTAWSETESRDRTNILRDLTFEIQPGTVTAVLGASGAGKSTLAKVLVGCWTNWSGELLVDGYPVQSLDPNELGSQMGYLPQDVSLFHGSIAENIARMAAPDSAWVIAAAKATDTHEFILRLPKGYDTVLGEPGGHLSGGQKQRVALARAIYGGPNLLVLDEPNANLDEAGEKSLFKTVLAMKQSGAAVVIISHRPNVVSLADQVLVMDSGNLAFRGTASEYQRSGL